MVERDFELSVETELKSIETLHYQAITKQVNASTCSVYFPWTDSNFP